MNPAKVLICTFTQTGSTDKVAAKIGEGLTDSGMKVTYHSILKQYKPDFRDFDCIGIGCPVYAFRPPFTVTDFVDSLPDLRKKHSFVFIQYGSNPGAAGNMLRKQLRKKHAIDAGYLLTRSEDYFISYLRRGYLLSPGYPGEFELQTAAEFGIRVAHRISHGYPVPEPYDPPTHPVYAIERASVSRLNAKLYLSRLFKLNNDCDGCGICIKNCPVNNLKPGKNKEPVWGSKCILCATCEFRCPKDAIRSPYNWAMNTPFYIFNIKKALKENTPYARVKFKNSRIILTP